MNNDVDWSTQAWPMQYIMLRLYLDIVIANFMVIAIASSNNWNRKLPVWAICNLIKHLWRTRTIWCVCCWPCLLFLCVYSAEMTDTFEAPTKPLSWLYFTHFLSQAFYAVHDDNRFWGIPLHITFHDPAWSYFNVRNIKLLVVVVEKNQEHIFLKKKKLLAFNTWDVAVLIFHLFWSLQRWYKHTND